MASSKDEPRQWQWIFRALWSAAPKLILDEGAGRGCASTTVDDLSSRRRRCQLHLLMPDTVLFERGVPRKWVGCSAEGTVVRKPFFRAPSTSGYGYGHMSSTIDDRADTPAATESRRPALAARIGVGRRQSPASREMDASDLAERLDAVIAAFLSFATALPTPSSFDGTNTSENPPVSVARYNDGSTELLSERSLRSLCGFHNWRASLCALQAYVRPAGQARTIVGMYAWRDDRHEVSRRRHRSIETRDGLRSEVRATAGSIGSSAINCGAKETRAHGASNTQNFSSATPVAFEGEQKQGREATGVDDSASRSLITLKSSAAAADQATKDVAFVTDASYAWPGDPSPIDASPRDNIDDGSNNQAPNDFEDNGTLDHSSTLEDRKLASHTGTNQSGARSVLIVGGPTGGRSSHRYPWPKSRIRVSRLETEFVIDQEGRLWFTNVTKV